MPHEPKTSKDGQQKNPQIILITLFLLDYIFLCGKI